MTIAIYPGSFDPITNGHIDILLRASKIFDHIIIAVLHNPTKKTFLTLTKKLELIQECVKSIPNVEVDSFDGLTVDYAKKKKAKVLIRGLRAVSDFEYEMQMAQMNKNLFNDLETIFLVPNIEYSFLSSSLIREVASFNGDVRKLVPDVVNKYLLQLNQ